MSERVTWNTSEVWLTPMSASKERAASGSTKSSTNAIPAAACQPKVPPRPRPFCPSVAISSLPSVICQ